MNKFKPGGQRNRNEFLGGRPKSDADYGTKNRFDKKPRHDDRGGFRRDNDRFDNKPKRDVELFDTTCTTCGKPCSVPFRPDGTKPVLCRDCFATKNASPSTNNFQPREQRDFGRREEPRKEWSQPSKPAAASVDIAPLVKQIAVLEVKMAEMVSLLREMKSPVKVPAPVEKKPEAKKEVVKAEAPKKEVAKPAKKVAPKKEVAKVEKKAVVKKAVAKKVAPKKAVKKVAKKK